MSAFAGKTALVTGGASGIGAAVVRALSDAGARVAVVDVAAGAAPAGGAWFTHDVADDGAWARTEAELRGAFGGLDFALVNAGIADSGAVSEMDFARWRRVMSVNLDGAFLTMGAALRLMRDGGAIVATSSISGMKAEPTTAAYGASKAALIQLVRVAAKESAPRKIRVNAIAPGGVDTPIWDGQDWFQAMIAEHGGNRAAAMQALAGMATPLGAYASAAEIAAQVLFLLGPSCASVTGAVWTVDGGYSL